MLACPSSSTSSAIIIQAEGKDEEWKREWQEERDKVEWRQSLLLFWRDEDKQKKERKFEGQRSGDSDVMEQVWGDSDAFTEDTSSTVNSSEGRQLPVQTFTRVTESYITFTFSHMVSSMATLSSSSWLFSPSVHHVRSALAALGSCSPSASLTLSCHHNYPWARLCCAWPPSLPPDTCNKKGSLLYIQHFSTQSTLLLGSSNSGWVLQSTGEPSRQWMHC